jgi:hypothetical protein
MLRAQTLKRRDHILLIHLHRVGDHTRGLFEADASIVVSAAHALQDVKVFFFVSHANVLFNYAFIPENPTFCVVTDSVVAAGFPPASTTMLTRAKIRHGSLNQVA